MKVIFRNRRQGKTTELIIRANLANNKNPYIVCMNQNRCQEIFKMAKKLNIKINFSITFFEFKRGGYYSKHISEFMIDDIDMLLQSMTDVKIDTVTLTNNAS